MHVTTSAWKPRDTDQCADISWCVHGEVWRYMVTPPRWRMSRELTCMCWMGGERRRLENLQSRLLLANLAVLAQNPYGCRRKHNSPDQTTARCSHLQTNKNRAMKHGREQVERRIYSVKGLMKKLTDNKTLNLIWSQSFLLFSLFEGSIVDWIPFARPFVSVTARLWFISAVIRLFHKIRW